MLAEKPDIIVATPSKVAAHLESQVKVAFTKFIFACMDRK